MLCRKPYSAWHGLYPCGQCMPCRINRRRVWSHRIQLESLMHGDNAFVTLTYEKDRRDLEPKHVQDWIKRVRHVADVRYYLVGEYGDNSLRPHYHTALFGWPRCIRGSTRIRRGSRRVDDCCVSCTRLQDLWRFGIIHSGVLEAKSAQYLAGYVTKKMTRSDDPRLDGRYPEFARMSLKPGIGYHAMHEVASALMQYDVEGDVPYALRHGRSLSLLGRYLRRNLRIMVGRDGKAPVNEELRQKMLDVLRNSVSNKVSLKEQMVAENEGRFASLVTKNQIFKQRKVKL